MAARDDGVSRSVACRVCRVLLTVEAATYLVTDHLVEDEGWTRDGDCWLCPRHGPTPTDAIGSPVRQSEPRSPHPASRFTPDHLRASQTGVGPTIRHTREERP